MIIGGLSVQTGTSKLRGTIISTNDIGPGGLNCNCNFL